MWTDILICLGLIGFLVAFACAEARGNHEEKRQWQCFLDEHR
jgi:hypothetical protein